MGNRWFIGDLHFRHAMVSELRGFKDVTEHDQTIQADWLKKVREGDEVFVLGDLSSGRAENEEYALNVLASLPGAKHLIAGNHDSVSSVHRTGWKRRSEYAGVFVSVRDFARIRVEGVDVLLSHYPYVEAGDGPGRPGSRYDQFRLPDLGGLLIHAHTHQSEMFREGWPHMMCVSWEAAGGLVHLREVVSWVNRMKGSQS